MSDKIQNFFNLNLYILHQEDWNNAYQISETIYLIGNNTQYISTFLKINSKMLLTTSILMAARTNYPDLLTVKLFLSLSDLKQRLKKASKDGILDRLGLEIANGYSVFLDCPDDPESEEIIIKTRNLVDRYLKKVELPDMQLNLRDRLLYLNQIFPIIKTNFEPTMLVSA